MLINNKIIKLINSTLIVMLFLFLAFGSDESKTKNDQKETSNCENSKDEYASGYSSGILCKAMGDYSSCESFVRNYNYETGRDILTASDCYCEGFDDGKDGNPKKYNSDIDNSTSNNNNDYSSSNEYQTEENENRDYEYKEEESEMNELETPATFPGGADGLRIYLANNIKYPESASKNGVEGIVKVSFWVSENGEVEDVSVEQGMNDCTECNQEAIRVFRNIPKFIPAEKDGVKIKTKMNSSIRFRTN
jgi:TonB family protein